MENLRLSAGDDSGFGLGRREGHAPSSNFGLGGLDMEGGLGGLSLGGGLGGLSMGDGLGGLSISGSGAGNFAPVNGQRERRGGFSNQETTSVRLDHHGRLSHGISAEPAIDPVRAIDLPRARSKSSLEKKSIPSTSSRTSTHRPAASVAAVLVSQWTRRPGKSRWECPPHCYIVK